MKNESCALKVILIFFEISYLTRFVWDQYISASFESKDPCVDEFAYEIGYDMSLYIDVLPFIALLLFHYSNFKQGDYAL